MSKNALKLFEDSLTDLSYSEIKVLLRVALAQRQREAKRVGLLKFWSSIYCLLENEKARRKRIVEIAELDMFDLEEPVIEWSGIPDPDPGQKITIFFDPPDDYAD